jgi:hypothetical protein
MGKNSVRDYIDIKEAVCPIWIEVLRFFSNLIKEKWKGENSEGWAIKSCIKSAKAPWGETFALF